MRCRIYSLGLATLLLFAAACGGGTVASNQSPDDKKEEEFGDTFEVDDGRGGKKKIVKPNIHTVLVTDQGIDVTHPVFKNKIVAAYTLDCPKPEDRSVLYAGKSFKELKKLMLDELKEPDGCQLKKGINLRLDPSYGQIASAREAWNATLLSKNPQGFKNVPNVDMVDDMVQGRNGYTYHGTATAGLIAYQNPNVRLVLLEITFYGAEMQKELKCTAAADHANMLKVLADPEYQEAYATRPESETDEQITRIHRDYQVTVTNFSGGSLPRKMVEKMYAEKGCPALDHGKEFELREQLEIKRTAFLVKSGAYDEVDTVDLQSAGNESTLIDSPRDGTCDHLDVGHVLVGSFDVRRNRSDFSNYGKCVTIYSMGTQIVVPAPGGFLNVMDGTSFSAPLATRHITLKYPPTMSRTAIIQGLLNEIDGQRYLPTDSYPMELSFEASDRISSYSLFDPFASLFKRRPPQLWTTRRLNHR